MEVGNIGPSIKMFNLKKKVESVPLSTPEKLVRHEIDKRVFEPALKKVDLNVLKALEKEVRNSFVLTKEGELKNLYVLLLNEVKQQMKTFKLGGKRFNI